jgi:hypothetical protein
MTTLRFVGLVMLGLIGFFCEAMIIIATLPFNRNGRAFFADVGLDLIEHFTTNEDDE